MTGKREKAHSIWLETYTKRAVTLVLAVSLIDLQLSYILAFMGKEQIAESLSIVIAKVVIGTMFVYCLKALFETFFEKREYRLNHQIEADLLDETENIEVLEDVQG